jgi:hypothetical protein
MTAKLLGLIVIESILFIIAVHLHRSGYFRLPEYKEQPYTQEYEKSYREKIGKALPAHQENLP